MAFILPPDPGLLGRRLRLRLALESQPLARAIDAAIWPSNLRNRSDNVRFLITGQDCLPIP